jgi:hypothetical protein
MNRSDEEVMAILANAKVLGQRRKMSAVLLPKPASDTAEPMSI